MQKLVPRDLTLFSDLGTQANTWYTYRKAKHYT